MFSIFRNLFSKMIIPSLTGRAGVGLLILFLFISCSDEQLPTGAQLSLVRQHLAVRTTSISYGYNTNLTASLTVEGENTAWELSGLPEWITASATKGNGAATITLTASENKSPDESRAAMLTFSSTATDYQYSKTISVSQPAADVYITPSENALNCIPAGESKMVTIASNVDWTAESSETWVTTSKSEDGQLRIKVEENLGTTRNATIYLKRTGTTTIVSTISVVQAEAGVTGSTEMMVFDVDGESRTTTIQAEASWTAYSSDGTWITVSPAIGNVGNATLTISTMANISTNARSGYVYIRIGTATKLSIPIQQEGVQYNVSDTSIELKSTTESGTFDVESNTGWSVVSKPDWLEVTPTNGAKGKTTLTVTPQDNPNTTQRSGSIVIGRDDFSGNKTVSVTQVGKTFGDLDSQMDFPNTGGNQSLTINTDGQWTASTATSWIHLSPQSGSGEETLMVTVDANPGKGERTGSIAVSVGNTTQTITVVQVGRYINISYDNLLTNSQPATIQLSVASNMEWSASSTSNWLTVSPTSGKGDATLTLTVTDNSSVNSRTGSILFKTADEEKEISITQPGRTLSVSATEISIDEEGGTSDPITVTTDGTYTVTSSESWATISQSGNSFTVTAAALTGDTRTTTITVSLTGLKNGESLFRNIKVLQRGASQDFTVTGNGKTVTFKMIKVKPGTFQMGHAGSEDVYTQVHSVTLTNTYFMGETEVTQGLWYAVMGQSPTSDGDKWESQYGIGDNYPAYRISYEDCQKFLTKLNQLTGQQFRFPTEAEWEFAAKGGTQSQGYTYAGSNTIGDVAWYTDNSGSKTHEVKTKKANELGLYDMSGNVWEWCADWYGSYSSGAQTNPTGATSGSYRVSRGGSWNNTASLCRVANRDYYAPSYRGHCLGFRLAL